jgi:hypothetical protein
MIRNFDKRLGAAPGPCDLYKEIHEGAIRSAATAERLLSDQVANYQKYYPDIKDPEALGIMTRGIDDARRYLEEADAHIQETKALWDECVKLNQTEQETQKKPEGLPVVETVKKTLVPTAIVLLVGYLALR